METAFIFYGSIKRWNSITCLWPKNPLIEYKKEGFSMFQEMMFDTNKETIKKIFRTNLVKTEDSSISQVHLFPKTSNQRKKIHQN